MRTLREIKFRGKRVDSGEWVEGFYVNYGFTGEQKPHIIPTYASALYAFEVIPETVGEFTGIRDSKRTEEYPEGQDIYEGDNVTYPDANLLHHDTFTGVGTVEYDEESMCFYFTDRETVKMDEICINIEVEVIGNIHDNPELMKESD